MGLASLNMTKYHDKLCPEGQTAFVNIKKKKRLKKLILWPCRMAFVD